MKSITRWKLNSNKKFRMVFEMIRQILEPSTEIKVYKKVDSHCNNSLKSRQLKVKKRARKEQKKTEQEMDNLTMLKIK